MTQEALEREFPYRYETHCHCCWCSACAMSEPQEMAQAYRDRGYAGMVLTDHFLLGNTAVDRRLPWEEKVQRYWEAYLAAKTWGDAHGFSVFFGLEHQYGGGKEVLTYGVDLEFLLSHRDLHLLPLSEYAAHINRCYEDIGVTESELQQFTNRTVYDATLWIAAKDSRTGAVAATGIADLDREIREGILEWIQVSPEYRGCGLGRWLVCELLRRMQGRADFATVSGRCGNPTNPEQLYRACGFTGRDVWHILTPV